MKYFILAFFMLAFFLGCGGIQKSASPKRFLAYGYDFTEYANKNFLFSPLELIDRPYDGRGLVIIEAWPEVKEQVEYVETSPGKVEPKTRVFPGKIDPSEIIKQAYDLAIGMGADALIQFKLTSKLGITTGNVEVTVLELSGFAIKRL